MTDIVEKLRDYANDDHERLCQGRTYSCSCGYDDKRDPLMTEAADTITALRAENERLRAALEEIASGKYSGIVLTSYPPQDPAVNRARAALEEKQ